MDDLDEVLGAMARRTDHPRLEGMETRLIARIAAERREAGDLPLGAALATVAAALGIGLASGQAVAGPSPAGLVTLDAGISLAPSTRLVSER